MQDLINKIHNADCLEFMKKLPDKSIDLVLTDPPYGIEFQSSWTEIQRFEKLHNDDKIEIQWMTEAVRLLKEGGAMYCFSRWDVYPQWLQAIKDSGLIVKNCIVWDRMSHGMGDLNGCYAPQHDFIIFATKGRHLLKGHKRPKDIIRLCRPNPNDIVHPTQKPVELIKVLLQNSSEENDIVLDCFLGSGTTAVACKQLNRKFIGIEINPDYCKISEERIKAVPQRLTNFASIPPTDKSVGILEGNL